MKNYILWIAICYQISPNWVVLVDWIAWCAILNRLKCIVIRHHCQLPSLLWIESKRIIIPLQALSPANSAELKQKICSHSGKKIYILWFYLFFKSLMDINYFLICLKNYVNFVWKCGVIEEKVIKTSIFQREIGNDCMKMKIESQKAKWRGANEGIAWVICDSSSKRKIHFPFNMWVELLWVWCVRAQNHLSAHKFFGGKTRC